MKKLLINLVDSALKVLEDKIEELSKVWRTASHRRASKFHEWCATMLAPFCPQGVQDRIEAVRYAFRAHDSNRAFALIRRYISEDGADVQLVAQLRRMGPR